MYSNLEVDEIFTLTKLFQLLSVIQLSMLEVMTGLTEQNWYSSVS